MIELIVKEYLEKKMKVPILLEHKKDEPKRFVIFEKIGSSKKNYTHSAIFAFQSYAESMYEAAKLNEDLKEMLEKMIEIDDIVSVKLSSDYNFTDINTKKYRYQAVFNIKY